LPHSPGETAVAGQEEAMSAKGPTSFRSALGRFTAGSVAALVAAGLSGCTGTPHDDTADPEPTGKPPYDAPAGGGEVRVADSGLSNTEDSAGEAMVSYAVVVENTSEQVAYLTEISIRLVDDSGEPVKDLVNGEQDDVSRAVYVLLPGATAALGATTYVEHAGVADLEIGVGDSQWWPADGPKQFAEITVDEVTAEPDGSDGATVGYTAESGYEQQPDACAVQAVFRDSAGKVVGGSNAGDVASPQCPPRGSPGEISVGYGLPSGIDLSKTEVYVDPNLG
jgi:hypothetical protein